MTDAVVLSFWVIFVAELGDKSQLMALAFAARYRPWPILAGITLATAVVHLFSVLVGGLLGTALPTHAINIVAGVAFLGFAAWTVRGDKLDDEEAARANRRARSPFVAVAGASEGEAVSILRAGALHFLQKPLDLEQFRLTLHALDLASSRQRLETLEQAFQLGF